jgi:hypothetical protein
MQMFLQANALNPSRPAFLCGGWYHDEIPTHLGGGTPGFKTWPVGPCDRIRPDYQQVSLEQWVQEAGELLERGCLLNHCWSEALTVLAVPLNTD